MKLSRLALPLAFAFALAASSFATAQTYNFKLGAHGCGSFNGTYYCDEIPITNTDGSLPEPNNGGSGWQPYVWSDILYNGRLNRFFMLTNYGLGNGTVTSYRIDILPTAPVSYQMNVFFTGPVLDANDEPTSSTYSAAVQYVYTIGTRSCSGRFCSTPWQILGGTGTATVNPSASVVHSNAVRSTSGPVSSSALTLPTKPIPEIGTEWVQVCESGPFTPGVYPTGRITSQGIEVQQYCYYWNTVLGDTTTPVWETWIIPWTIWWLPGDQNSTCEVANYPSSCNQFNTSKIQASTPSFPSK